MCQQAIVVSYQHFCLTLPEEEIFFPSCYTVFFYGQKLYQSPWGRMYGWLYAIDLLLTLYPCLVAQGAKEQRVLPQAVLRSGC